MQESKTCASGSSHDQDGLSSATMIADCLMTVSLRGKRTCAVSNIDGEYASSQTLSLEAEDRDPSATERGSPTIADEEDSLGNNSRIAGRFDLKELAKRRPPFCSKFPNKPAEGSTGSANYEDGSAQSRPLASTEASSIAKGDSGKARNNTRQRRKAQEEGEQKFKKLTPTDITRYIIPKVSHFF